LENLYCEMRFKNQVLRGSYGPSIGCHQHLEDEYILPEPSPAIELRKRKVWSSNDNFSEV